MVFSSKLIVWKYNIIVLYFESMTSFSEVSLPTQPPKHFSIECRETKTKAIKTSNQKEGKYLWELTRTQSKNNQTAWGTKRPPSRDWF